MSFIKRILFTSVFLLAGASAALAQTQAPRESAGLGTVTEPLGERYKTPRAVVSPLSRVTFYRAATGYGNGVTSLLINGHYHTSLQAGSFAELCMSAPTRVALSSRVVMTGEQVKNYVDATTGVTLKSGQDAYVRVSEMANGRAQFAVVDASVAQNDLKQTRRQVHAVSRVQGALPCEAEEVASPKPVLPVTQIEAITLGSDALFAFGKSDAAGISDEGRAELDRLIARLQKQYGNFEKITVQVVGYADPLGTEAANKRLSAARAQTIKNYMIAGGIASSKITSEGRGATSPIVTKCPREATPLSIECNKPNRRVVVGVSTVAR